MCMLTTSLVFIKNDCWDKAIKLKVSCPETTYLFTRFKYSWTMDIILDFYFDTLILPPRYVQKREF